MKKPIIGITLGDPAGIGPEIIVKALYDKALYDKCKPLVVGDAAFIKKAITLLDYNLKINKVKKVEDSEFTYGTIDVYVIGVSGIEKMNLCKATAQSGKLAFLSVDKVIDLAIAKQVDATVTAPINKHAIYLAGYKYSGHTEIYAEKTDTNDYTMMLADKNLRVVHVSTHVSLKQACERVKKEKILSVIKLAHDACLALNINDPRIAVAGLNPHCGENGMFGTEEIEEISPAVKEALKQGINVFGPIPADTVFSKAKGGMYDIVVAMYHDQGHIPLKVVGFNYDDKTKKWVSVSGVNITLGLPIIRTSVDHGTAYDLAWQGLANKDSMVNAIDYAIKLTNMKDERNI